MHEKRRRSAQKRNKTKNKKLDEPNLSSYNSTSEASPTPLDSEYKSDPSDEASKRVKSCLLRISNESNHTDSSASLGSILRNFRDKVNVRGD